MKKLKKLLKSLTSLIAKHKYYTIIITLVIIFGLLLVYFRYNYFVLITKRLLQIKNIEDLKCFFESDSQLLEDTISDAIKGIEEGTIEVITSRRSWQSKIKAFLVSIQIFITKFLLLFINIILNITLIIYLYLHNLFTATNLKIKYSVPARIYLAIIYIISYPFIVSRKIMGSLTGNIRKHKQFLLLSLTYLLLSSGIIYKVIAETIIFLIVYIHRSLNQKLLSLLESLFKYLFELLFPSLKGLPPVIYLFLFLVFIFYRAVLQAENRLKHNHKRLKKIVKEELTQTTFINGAPGSGKTLLNTSFSLASEENFIEELEEKMLNYQIKFPHFNFAEIRKNQDARHQEYSNYFKLLNNRGTFLITNFAIYSPYFKEFSKIFDFNYMRKNIKSEIYPLEEYIVIAISELDKEYNSHDDTKKVGTDGAATFFSTTSHDLKRHVKIFCDYQLKDQVPLRIRGNSEFFYTIKKREKKYPFLLYCYFKPFIFLNSLIKNCLKKYESERPFINKKTKRKTISKYKRNDVNLVYLLLREFAFILSKIIAFFDHYWFFSISGDLSQQDGATGEEKVIEINICDLSFENKPIYDSTFLSHAYAEKKNTNFADLPRFTSLTPTIAELTLCHSQFYDKINGLTVPEVATPKESSPRKSEEFIEINASDNGIVS